MPESPAVMFAVSPVLRTVLVTRFGEPVAQVAPPHGSSKTRRWVGSLAGTSQINGDIVSPASQEDESGCTAPMKRLLDTHI